MTNVLLNIHHNMVNIILLYVVIINIIIICMRCINCTVYLKLFILFIACTCVVSL